ncbi:hypothetical protein [Stenotrophomonas lactitubi]|uniref:hypothetical protein n=1 Tax=Stenotrophomonas lactitubi TaxID=2045214 RepID=UPI001E517B2E|nr:hypothetical protein [Stenotrophomonas lactitubi]
MSLGDQAAELCMQIRRCVESWWLYDALGDYIIVKGNQGRARSFAHAYSAIWSSSFDTMIVAAYSLIVTSRDGKPLTLVTFADELDASGIDARLASALRSMPTKHDRFVKALQRIRNKATAHVDRAMPTQEQFNDALLGTEWIREFLQDLVYLFHAIARLSSKEIGPPDDAVRAQMQQMLHLAIRQREQIHRSVDA